MVEGLSDDDFIGIDENGNALIKTDDSTSVQHVIETLDILRSEKERT